MSKVKPKRRKLSRKLDTIAKNAEKVVNKSLKELANETLVVAKTALFTGTQDPLFRQKHGAELVDYLTVEKQGNTFLVSAGAYESDHIRWELFFAEYGAGTMKNSATLGVDISNKDSAFFYQHYGHHYTAKGYDFWYYPLINPETTESGKLRFYKSTSRSLAIGYMAQARLYLHTAYKSKLRQIKTNLFRGKTIYSSDI